MFTKMFHISQLGMKRKKKKERKNLSLFRISCCRPRFKLIFSNFLSASIASRFYVSDFFLLFLSSVICQLCPILSVWSSFSSLSNFVHIVQFSILSHFQFCPIFNFVQFPFLSNFQFCPISIFFLIFNSFQLFNLLNFVQF